jgi:hypothetical protein
MTPKDALSIVRLPLEVLEVIIEFAALDAQLCISRVSKLFHSLNPPCIISKSRLTLSACRCGLLSNAGIEQKNHRHSEIIRDQLRVCVLFRGLIQS